MGQAGLAVAPEVEWGRAIPNCPHNSCETPPLGITAPAQM